MVSSPEMGRLSTKDPPVNEASQCRETVFECLLQILQILKDIDVNIRYLLEVAAVCLGRSYTLSNSRKYKKLLHQDKSEKKNKYRKIDKHEVGGSQLSVSLLCCHNNLIIAAILV